MLYYNIGFECFPFFIVRIYYSSSINVTIDFQYRLASTKHIQVCTMSVHISQSKNTVAFIQGLFACSYNPQFKLES